MVGRTESSADWVCVEVSLQGLVGEGDLRARVVLAGAGDAAAGAAWRAAGRLVPLPRRVAAVSGSGALLLPITPLHLLQRMQPITMVSIPESWKHGWSDSEDEEPPATVATPACDQVDGGKIEQTRLNSLKRHALALLEQHTVCEDTSVKRSVGSSVKVNACSPDVKDFSQDVGVMEDVSLEVSDGPGPRRRRRVRRRRRGAPSPPAAPSPPGAPSPPAAPSPGHSPGAPDDSAITRDVPTRNTPRVIHAL